MNCKSPRHVVSSTDSHNPCPTLTPAHCLGVWQYFSSWKWNVKELGEQVNRELKMTKIKSSNFLLVLKCFSQSSQLLKYQHNFLPLPEIINIFINFYSVKCPEKNNHKKQSRGFCNLFLPQRWCFLSWLWKTYLFQHNCNAQILGEDMA